MTTDFPDYRHLARESLARAKEELAANKPDRLRYAALELRDAMEALTYDRALALKDEIPPEEYETWQPRQLMALLVDIDPTIGITSTVSIGQEKDGKPATREEMKTLGTDHVLTLGTLRAHYNAIGSFLHVPSLEQVQARKMPDLARLRERCEVIVAEVEKALSSRIRNVRIGYPVALDRCMNDNCKKPIRKTMPVGKDTIDVQCFHCEAQYTITTGPRGDAIWTPKVTEAPCSTPGCPEKMQLWPHEIQLGMNWRCRGCGAHNEIQLSVFNKENIPA
jgi:hypothetical protein